MRMFNPFPSDDDLIEDEIDLDTELRFRAERHPGRVDPDAANPSDPDWWG